MQNTKKTIDLFTKYRNANIIRFIAEIIFVFALCLTYASMVAEFCISLGPIFLIITPIAFVVSIVFEVKRLMIYKKIKNSENKVEKT